MEPLDLFLVRARTADLQREAREAALARQLPARPRTRHVGAVALGTRAGLAALAGRVRSLRSVVPAGSAAGGAAGTAGGAQVCCA
ncbi:hypothetical protein [Aquipuribacter nitratireducens]|uniref:Uncharacterized protein n=1 Tax=Aquipuribacter nitratireducens TaxID=650104 RepID=A0ABW0GPY1_9MICO